MRGGKVDFRNTFFKIMERVKKKCPNQFIKTQILNREWILSNIHFIVLHGTKQMVKLHIFAQVICKKAKYLQEICSKDYYIFMVISKL